MRYFRHPRWGNKKYSRREVHQRRRAARAVERFIDKGMKDLSAYLIGIDYGIPHPAMTWIGSDYDGSRVAKWLSVYPEKNAS